MTKWIIIIVDNIESDVALDKWAVNERQKLVSKVNEGQSCFIK